MKVADKVQKWFTRVMTIGDSASIDRRPLDAKTRGD